MRKAIINAVKIIRIGEPLKIYPRIIIPREAAKKAISV